MCFSAQKAIDLQMAMCHDVLMGNLLVYCFTFHNVNVPCNPNIALVFLVASQCEYNSWEGEGDCIGQIWNWLVRPDNGFTVPGTVVVGVIVPSMLLQVFPSSIIPFLP